jgi:hypothetical protein
MKARIAMACVSAALVAAAGLPTAAYAGPTDNNDASVVGVSPQGDNVPCASGNFCIYTGTRFTGLKFELFHCRLYQLRHWNGNGSVINNNTGGAHGKLLNKDKVEVTDMAPGDLFTGYFYGDIWYVKAC